VASFPLWQLRFDPRPGYVEFVVAKVALSQVLSVLEFPLPVLIQPAAPHSLIINAYEELHNLYSSPDKIRMIKSRRVRWAGHVA
jgi:hypothetical protein